jgi:quercetin dioxygenase-like cupin family protein
MKFSRMYADEHGNTHLGVLEVPHHDAALGPPPNPVGRMTDRIPVSSLVTFSAPAGTEAAWHNAPQPYICIVLSGVGEVVASDGTTLRLGPGEVVFFDDVTGNGHITRALTDLHIALVNRAGE